MSSLRIRALLASVLAIVSLPAVTHATTLYATSYEQSSLWKVDTVALTATQIWSTTPVGQQPDSLVFDAAGNILYSTHFPGGGVRSVNLSSSTDTSLATWTGHTTDLALEPSLNSVLASDYIDPNLRRVSLSGGATVLSSGMYFSGTAYVGNRLFANAGSTYQHGGDRVYELNPVTGAVITSTISNPAGVNAIGDLDSLCYDPFTGHLWATDESAGALIDINPSTLATVAHPLPASLITGGQMLPDGLCSDGTGNLFFASRGDFYVYQYNVSANTSSPLVNIYGLDDLAPASGLGSSPEPASLLAACGLAFPFALRQRRR